mgnify:CR=1 FL=1
MNDQFDLRRSFRLPFISVPGKFCTRLTMAAAWGCALGGAPEEMRSAFGATLVAFSLLMSASFFGWDRKPVDAARMALYGLYVAGEAMVVGCCCMAFLSAAGGELLALPMILTGFAGSLFTLYPMALLVKNNIPEHRGS